MKYLGKGVNLIKIDINGLIALEKPIGILSHPNGNYDYSKSLISGQYDRSQEKYVVNNPLSLNKKDNIWLINRLDSGTSGLILATYNKKLDKIVKNLFKKRKVEKIYFALVFGDIKEKMELVNPISISKIQYLRAFRPKNQSKIAITIVNKVHYSRKYDISLIKVQPVTGFTHQIRFQCAVNGFPIVGDKIYGNFLLNRRMQKVLEEKMPKCLNLNRLFLHSHKISFSYPFETDEIFFEAISQIPPEFTVFYD